ncbi:MAG TPA: winged helix-turn-helix domain-containing protein [Xanthomonadaceae bacterium]|nr:winged helix-turn-helix domain-containing protein [Xanthomonadaceae bacterium]
MDATILLSDATPRVYAFREFVLDLDRGALRRDGVDVRLRPKSFAVLRHLVERHGQLIGKQQLFDAIWGHHAVTDGVLTQCLIDIRRALGDDAQQMIRTVPRRGYLFDVPITPVMPAPAAAPPSAVTPGDSLRPWRWRVAATAVLLLASASIAWVAYQRRAPIQVEVPPASPTPSIAVLPFADMSPGRDQEYFADGISEEILNLLAQTPGLRVTARTSSFSFKGSKADIATIAARLGVDHVLEGSVRRSGNHVRITAQLVDVVDSSHRWSQTYDHEVDDVLDVQAEVAAAVVNALKLALAEPPGAAGLGSNDLAYEAYLQGLFFYNRRNPGDLLLATKYYRHALSIDPAMARAWAELAGVYGARVHDGSLQPEEGLRLRHQAITRALARGPTVAEAHVRAAQYYWDSGEPGKALVHTRQAQAYGPNNPLVLSVSAGIAVLHGRLDEAIALSQRAVDIDPLAVTFRGNLAAYLLAAGQLERAHAELVKANELARTPLELDPTLADILILQRRFGEAAALVSQWPEGDARDLVQAMAYPAIGRRAEADAALARLQAGPGMAAAVRLAEVHAFRGDSNAAFRWLGIAQQRSNAETKQPPEREWRWRIAASPFLRPLHGDPRWQPLSRQLRAPRPPQRSRSGA